MRQRKFFLFFLFIVGCAFLLFTGCPTGNDGIPGEEEEETTETTQDSSGTITIKDLTIMAGTKYLSLKTGKTVAASKKNTTEWDIAVAASMFVFRTNSGVTAADVGSEGNAYIWYTNKTDFNAVTLADRVDSTHAEYDSELGDELAPYAQDVTRYSYLMDGVNEIKINMMTYFGFNSGSGLSSEDPFRSIPRDPDGEEGPLPAVPLADYIFYHFNKKSAYEGTGGMPPGFKATGQIYIIRHADGLHHSKFQVTKFAYGYSMDLKFQQLD